MPFFWTLYSKNSEKSFMVSTKILSSTTAFNIDDNDFWSCDTEDWSNDAKNSALT